MLFYDLAERQLSLPLESVSESVSCNAAKVFQEAFHETPTETPRPRSVRCVSMVPVVYDCETAEASPALAAMAALKAVNAGDVGARIDWDRLGPPAVLSFKLAGEKCFSETLPETLNETLGARARMAAWLASLLSVPRAQ